MQCSHCSRCRPLLQCFIGTPEGTRTPNLHVRSVLLLQLSYGSIMADKDLRFVDQQSSQVNRQSKHQYESYEHDT
jgi:hypothetical protein